MPAPAPPRDVSVTAQQSREIVGQNLKVIFCEASPFINMIDSATALTGRNVMLC
jgi:hypothetical protein